MADFPVRLRHHDAAMHREELARAINMADYAFEVARGNVTGVSSVQKFGRNQSIGSGTQEDIWDGGATWVAPTVARTHTVASTSGSDAAGGVGARTIQVWFMV